MYGNRSLEELWSCTCGCPLCLCRVWKREKSLEHQKLSISPGQRWEIGDKEKNREVEVTIKTKIIIKTVKIEIEVKIEVKIKIIIPTTPSYKNIRCPIIIKIISIPSTKIHHLNAKKSKTENTKKSIAHLVIPQTLNPYILPTATIRIRVITFLRRWIVIDKTSIILSH